MDIHTSELGEQQDVETDADVMEVRDTSQHQEGGVDAGPWGRPLVAVRRDLTVYPNQSRCSFVL